MGLNKGQRNLLLLAVVFFAPILVAYVVLNNLQDKDGFTTKNFGELIAPAKPVQDFEFTAQDKKPFKLSSLRGKWVLTYVGLSSCDDKCKTSLYNMRQARLGQRGEHKRIERVYISLDGNQVDLPQAFKKDHSGVNFIVADKSAVSNILQLFDSSLEDVRAGKYGLYIIDPLGNLMMRYPDGFQPKGLAKDLELLLKASQIG